MIVLQELLFLVFLIFLALKFFPKKGKGDGNLPTGPSAMPLLGNVIQMLPNPHLKLSQWAGEYGDLYTIKMGTKRAVVMSSVKSVKEILCTTPSTGKFKTDVILLISRGPYGIANTEGREWAEVRKFCVRNLKEFGYGSHALEPFILDEADRIIDWIKLNNSSSKISSGTAYESDTTRLYKTLHLSNNSSFWSMLTGMKLEIGDTRLDDMLNNLVDSIQYATKTGLAFFPRLKYLSKKWMGYDALDKATKDLAEYIKAEFERHKETYKERQSRDLMDYYIEHLEKVDDPNSSFFGEKGYENAVATFVEIFLAGAETTSLTVTWAMIYLAVFPEVQKKLKREIEEILGKDEPNMEHKPRMPYLDAVILETFRLSSLLPFGIIHELLDDLKYEGYVIPKGTLLIPNMYHIHHDKQTWGDPENFRPERFLSEGSEQLKDFVIPFQLGKRSCPGEPLAKDTIFLYMAKLFQKLEVIADASIPKQVYTEPAVGYGLLPKTHRIYFKEKD